MNHNVPYESELTDYNSWFIMYCTLWIRTQCNSWCIVPYESELLELMKQNITTVAHKSEYVLSAILNQNTQVQLWIKNIKASWIRTQLLYFMNHNTYQVHSWNQNTSVHLWIRTQTIHTQTCTRGYNHSWLGFKVPPENYILPTRSTQETESVDEV